MYKEYWKLSEKPFHNTADPRFIYYSSSHEEALTRMRYAVQERKSASMLTGGYGSGKTLLSRILFKELSSEQYQTVFIFNPRLPALELIKEIVYQLGSETSSLGSKIDLLHRLNEILYRGRNENKYTVIVIDEAQTIPDEDTFEELRLLLNFQLDDSFLLTLIFLGQPELQEKIDNLPQLKERMGVVYHLKALSQKEIEEYVKHRLKVAGAVNEIFQEDAFSEIYKYSRGIPRRINDICDRALFVGFAEALEKIDKRIIIEVAEDLELTTPDNIDKKTGLTT